MAGAELECRIFLHQLPRHVKITNMSHYTWPGCNCKQSSEMVEMKRRVWDCIIFAQYNPLMSDKEFHGRWHVAQIIKSRDRYCSSS